MARVLIAIASFFAIFFWIQVISFWLGGHPGDQMVKQGLARFAIGIGVLNGTPDSVYTHSRLYRWHT